jgi:hypothetical protein
MALAVPTDALDRPVPAELQALSAAADKSFTAARSGNWKRAAASLDALSAAWKAYPVEQRSPRLASEMSRALKGLSVAIDARNKARAGTAAIDVAESTLDLELRYRPPAEIDRARFELWARQLLVDSAARNMDGVRGDVATLEWIRDRFAGTLDAVDRTRIDSQLVTLRSKVGDEDLRALAAGAARLRATLRG